MDSALIEEAAKKSGVVWVGPRIAWHVWHDGAIYIVTGGAEQDIPGLEDGGTAEVTLPSKTSRGALGSVTADVAVVEPGTEEWDAVLPLLAKSRLNAAQGQVEAWAERSRIVRLTPQNTEAS